MYLFHFIFNASNKEVFLSASEREKAQKVNFAMLTEEEKNVTVDPPSQLFSF